MRAFSARIVGELDPDVSRPATLFAPLPRRRSRATVALLRQHRNGLTTVALPLR